MNILLINHYAGSPDMGMEFRPYYMAREWTRVGHDVTIIAGDYSHLRIKNPEVSQDFQEQDIDGIRYVWVKTGEYDGNGAARAFTMFRFVRKLWLHAKTIAETYKPDVIIASSTYPLDTYAAQKIATFVYAKYIHEIHDMWPATLYEIGGMSRSHPFVRLMQRAEDSFCKNADVVVSLLGGAQGYLVEHGMAPDKFAHITNGIVEEEWAHPAPLPAEHRELLEGLHAQGKFVVGYFGGHALSNALDMLLDAAAALKDRQDIAFVLVGKGVEKPQLQQRAAREGLANVRFLSPIEKRAIPSLLQLFDCSYIGGRPSGLAKYGLGVNKLFDSMMGGKPIVFAVRCVEDPVTDFNCGITVNPDKTEEIAEAILRFSAADEVELRSLGENGRRAAQENFTYRVLAQRFLQVMG